MTRSVSSMDNEYVLTLNAEDYDVVDFDDSNAQDGNGGRPRGSFSRADSTEIPYLNESVNVDQSLDPLIQNELPAVEQDQREDISLDDDNSDHEHQPRRNDRHRLENADQISSDDDDGDPQSDLLHQEHHEAYGDHLAQISLVDEDGDQEEEEEEAEQHHQLAQDDDVVMEVQSDDDDDGADQNVDENGGGGQKSKLIGVDEKSSNESFEDIMSNSEAGDHQEKIINNKVDAENGVAEDDAHQFGDSRQLEEEPPECQLVKRTDQEFDLMEEACKILHKKRDETEEGGEKGTGRRKQVFSSGEQDVEGQQRENFVITCINDKLEEAKRNYKNELAKLQSKTKRNPTDSNDATDANDNTKGSRSTSLCSDVIEKVDECNELEEGENSEIIEEEEEDHESHSSLDSSSSSSESSAEEGEEKTHSTDRRRTSKRKADSLSGHSADDKRKILKDDAVNIKSGRRSRERHLRRRTTPSDSFQADKKYVKDIPKFQAFFVDARYFLIKSANAENVILSKVKGVWSTTPRNEQMLNRAYRRHRNVILIFSVEKSQAYQGFCRMCSESNSNGSPINWVLPRGMSSRVLSASFKVHWLNRNDLSFVRVQHLYNPWNDDKPIKIARDGTEFAPEIGKRLCQNFVFDPAADYEQLIKDCKLDRPSDAPAITRPLTPPRGVLSAVAMERLKRQQQSQPFPAARRVGRLASSSSSSMAPPGVSQRGAGGRPTSRKYVREPQLGRERPSMMAGGGRKLPPSHSAGRYHTAASSSSGRSGGGYNDVLINGSYSDYIRQYTAIYPAASTLPASYAAYSSTSALNAYSSATAAAYYPASGYSGTVPSAVSSSYGGRNASGVATHHHQQQHRRPMSPKRPVIASSVRNSSHRRTVTERYYRRKSPSPRVRPKARSRSPPTQYKQRRTVEATNVRHARR